MIQSVKIKNFKSHKDSGEIKFTNLTVLCGDNSVGKSSIFQPLLLLREAHFNKNDFEYLDLLTDSVKIGNIQDALYENAQESSITFQIKTHFQEYYFKFTNEKDGNLKNYIDRDKDFAPIKVNSEESLFNQNFQYISSARIKPKISYQRNDVIVEKLKQISENDGEAEFTVHYLHLNQNVEVYEKLLNSNYKGNTLLNQVIAWEREISENVLIETVDLGNKGFELIYKYEGDYLAGKSLNKSPINVGFGLTYTLPILVAILSAKLGALIIIENPEAHLHPNGISKLTELLCKASQAGIQIVIETHSDHIINGILVQCKKFEESQSQTGIDRGNVSIYQLERDEKNYCSIVIPIPIEEGGRIYNKPRGFFDQIANDLRDLY